MTLIAYFSRTGKNYVDGRIVNLSVGNTAVVAKKIQERTCGDLFPIETVKPYPADYTETTNITKEETRNSARPQLKKLIAFSEYDIIYLGYPNWWGTMPMAVFTFLESCECSGETIAPFCTHEGSGLGHSLRDIKKTCPNAKVLPGLSIRGGSVKESDTEIKEWLMKINLTPLSY